jgi:hypothetical protein
LKRKYTLRFDANTDRWVLRHEGTRKVLGQFKSKEAGTRAGVLRKLLGRQGGTVVIRTKTGVFEEERNFPGTGSSA